MYSHWNFSSSTKNIRIHLDTLILRLRNDQFETKYTYSSLALIKRWLLDPHRFYLCMRTCACKRPNYIVVARSHIGGGDQYSLLAMTKRERHIAPVYIRLRLNLPDKRPYLISTILRLQRFNSPDQESSLLYYISAQESARSCSTSDAAPRDCIYI